MTAEPLSTCPKWFRNFKLEQSDGATCLRSANGKPLQEYGKRQIWLIICGQTKRYDFHVLNVDEADLECKLLVRTRSWNTLSKEILLEVWWCLLRRGANGECMGTTDGGTEKLVSTICWVIRKVMSASRRVHRENS